MNVLELSVYMLLNDDEKLSGLETDTFLVQIPV